MFSAHRARASQLADVITRSPTSARGLFRETDSCPFLAEAAPRQLALAPPWPPVAAPDPLAARPHGDLPVVAELATLVDMAWARSTQARQLEGQGLEARTQAADSSAKPKPR